jgi:hypothetical protein
MRLIFMMTLLCPLLAEARTIVVEDGRCRVVERHVPDEDVAYKPGVDVNGRAVVPADLNGGNQVVTPRFVTIPLNIPITEFLPVRPPFLDAVEVDAGLILVDTKTGFLSYDGQRLDQPRIVLCEDDDNGGVRILNLPPPPPRLNG